jgi:ABC-type Fe3+-hydroxamate transport system substrate-binding protein
MDKALKLFFISLMVVVLSACSRAPSSQPVAGSSTTTPEDFRFVAMSPAIAIMLRDLGFEDQIVGKHAWDMVLADSVPVVGSETGVDYESMIRADPTHIFFQRSTSGVPEKLSTMAEERGWQVLSMPLDSLDDIATGADDIYMKFVGVRERGSRELDPTVRFTEVSMPSEALARAWADLGPVADKAGRVLVLGSIEPPGAMGPGSFHHQLVERLGAGLALSDGSMWQELDFEDIVRLNPDSIILFSPKLAGESDLFAPVELTDAEVLSRFGKLGELDINAVHSGRLAVIDNPLGLIPSTTFGKIGEQLAEILTRWGTEP